MAVRILSGLESINKRDKQCLIASCCRVKTDIVVVHQKFAPGIKTLKLNA